MRIAAIDSLAFLRSRSVLPVLLALAQDRDVDVACAALAALSHFEPDASHSALRRALDSGDAALMRAAFASVAAHRAHYAVPILAAQARELRDEELRHEAVLTIGRIGGAAGLRALIDLTADRTLRETVTAALGAISDPDVATLREMMSDPDERHRRVIVDGLARMKNESVAGVLAMALDDSSPGVRLAATRALGRIDLRGARTQLAAIARTDENPAIRVAALDALSR